MPLDAAGCIGASILTHSGIYFDFDDPTPEQIKIEDIATALGNTCRYGGHCRFYSVAEHSVLCASVAQQKEPGNLELARHALMHDAAEAYIGDMPKPLKRIMPEFRAMEDRIEAVVRETFGLIGEFEDQVKWIDLAMLKAEKLWLFPRDRTEWGGLSGLPVLEVELKLWGPRAARSAFLHAYRDLFGRETF